MNFKDLLAEKEKECVLASIPETVVKKLGKRYPNFNKITNENIARVSKAKYNGNFDTGGKWEISLEKGDKNDKDSLFIEKKLLLIPCDKSTYEYTNKENRDHYVNNYKERVVEVLQDLTGNSIIDINGKLTSGEVNKRLKCFPHCSCEFLKSDDTPQLGDKLFRRRDEHIEKLKIEGVDVNADRWIVSTKIRIPKSYAMTHSEAMDEKKFNPEIPFTL